MPLSPAFSIIRYFIYWFEPLIVKPLAVEPLLRAFLKLMRGYVPSDCLTPTIPPDLLPESFNVDVELIVISGVLI